MSESTAAEPVQAFVVHWNAPDRAVATIQSLRASKNVVLDITVIDNASDPAAVMTLRERLGDGVRFVPLHSNVGFAGAANFAIRKATEGSRNWFLLASHDAIADARCVAGLVAAMEGDPKLGVVAPLLWDLDGRVFSTGGRWSPCLGPRDVPMPQSSWHMREGTRLLAADWVSGTLMLIRSECAVQLGGFDERLFAYCEDVDFGLRATAAGWGVSVNVDAHASQHGSTIDERGRGYLMIRNSLLVTKKLGGPSPYLFMLSRVVGRGLRAAGGALLLWRPAMRRSSSLSWARIQLSAAVDSLRWRAGPSRLAPRIATRGEG